MDLVTGVSVTLNDFAVEKSLRGSLGYVPRTGRHVNESCCPHVEARRCSTLRRDHLSG